MSRFYAFRTLSRLSLLPTIWSNCLAGWWLGEGGHTSNLPWLFIGATLLYLGGTFLRDAIEAELGRHQSQGPSATPASGALRTLWRWSLALLALGSLCLIGIGRVTGTLGLVLLVFILAEGAVPRTSSLSPPLAGLTRFFIYILAASTAVEGVTGWAIWCGLALAAYVAGAGYLARPEGSRGFPQYWPLLLAAAPIALALVMNADGYREPALLLSLILALWIARSLRPGLWSPEHDLVRTKSALLAGIVLVDMLAVADAPRKFDLLFLLLFVVALSLRRSAAPAK